MVSGTGIISGDPGALSAHLGTPFARVPVPIFRSNWPGLFASRVGRMHASEIRELLKLVDQPDIVSFAGGLPDPSLFPISEIGAAYAEILGNPALAGAALQYSVSEGHLPLRRWIVDHMATLGVPCDVDNIVVTSGSQQGLDFIGKLFLSKGDTALVQEPTYLGALQAFNSYEPRYDVVSAKGAERASALSDAAGMNGGRVAFSYVIPDFANPSGDADPRRAAADARCFDRTRRAAYRRRRVRSAALQWRSRSGMRCPRARAVRDDREKPCDLPRDLLKDDLAPASCRMDMRGERSRAEDRLGEARR